MTKFIYVAGHTGMAGSAICRQLAGKDDVTVVTASHRDLDLREQTGVRQFFGDNRIDEIYLAAARVGGILANYTYPANFIYDNLVIESNIIDAACRSGVKKLLFLGSSCIYPVEAEQPIKEEALLEGKLESTNEPYAIAKIAGIKLCESYNRQYGMDYRAIMPTNLYGPNDNFHPENSHVIPGLLRRFHEAAKTGAPEVIIWGSGTPRREFLHVDDMADAALFIMGLTRESYHNQVSPRQIHINVGTGSDCTIAQLAKTIARITGFKGRIALDTSKPDGSPRKLLSVERLRQLGWRPRIGLEEGLENTYRWFLDNEHQLRR